MHPVAELSELPLPVALARRGVHVLAARSRFARNDSTLVVEKVLLQLKCNSVI